MPHSLRSKIKGLRYKGIITDKDCNRLCKALENEVVLDKIREEIENHCGLIKENHCKYCSHCNSVMGVREILEIIDKYTAEIKPQERSE